MEILQEEINRIHFCHCEDIEMGDVLHYLIDGKLLGKTTWISGIKSIIYMFLYCACSKSYRLEANGKPRSLFLFSNSYRGREDHYKAFQDVVRLAERNYVKMVCAEHKVNLYGIKHFLYTIQWNRQLKHAVPQFGKRIAFVRMIFQAYMDYEYMHRQCKKHGWEIETLVVYCDVMPVDNFFVQKFNCAGKQTVTLQHGSYSLSGWQFKASRSRCFLAESLYAEECAKICGYRGKLIPVGSPHHIKLQDYKKNNPKKIERIGVFTDGGRLSVEANAEMILAVQNYCRQYNKKIYLKFHPSNSLEDYVKYVDSDITTVLPIKEIVSEIAELIDAAIISSSTVFTTMLKAKIPVFLYGDKNCYKDGSISLKDITFYDEFCLKELINKTEAGQYVEKWNMYGDYFAGKGSIADNYRKAFREIGIIQHD